MYPGLAQSIEENQRDTDLMIVSALSRIALGEDPMTDSMRELLILSPKIKLIWEEYLSRVNAVDGSTHETHGEQTTRRIIS